MSIFISHAVGQLSIQLSLNVTSMKVYCELSLDQIRLKVNGDELDFNANEDFYRNHFLSRTAISRAILWHLRSHERTMNILEGLKQRISRNNVYMLVSQEVQQLVTLPRIHHFGIHMMNGRTVYVFPKPSTFDSSQLETIASKLMPPDSSNSETLFSQLLRHTKERIRELSFVMRSRLREK
jgi:hypothetical protein